MRHRPDHTLLSEPIRTNVIALCPRARDSCAEQTRLPVAGRGLPDLVSYKKEP
jgi:hypothetical protein